LNGTYLDGARLDAAMMRDMQEVQIGRFVLTFVVGTGPGSHSDGGGSVAS
jgi:hypothetical protein